MSSMMEIDDDAAEAYASLSAKLDTWTSPPLGNRTHATYEEDADEWLVQQTTPMITDGGRGTPIMSNTGAGVMSPWTERVVASTVVDSRYRTYHDALWRFMQARRNLADRMLLAREEAQLDRRQIPDVNTMLTQDDERMDSELLSSLSFDTPLFSLLGTLRTLGVHAILWDETVDHKTEVRQTMTYLATQTFLTQAKLIEKLHSSSSSPLILQRRKAILKWLQGWNTHSLDQLRLPNKTNAMWPQSLEHLTMRGASHGKITTIHPDAPLLIQERNMHTEPLYGTDNDQDKLLLQACLAYIMAGRMDLAQKACQQQCQPWRCAIWNGGMAHDVVNVPNDKTQEMVSLQKGNPARFLWKRQVAKLVKAVTTDEEAAIYALLCNDMASALRNSALRTWQAGLYTCFTAIQGRVEDELLQLAGKSRNYEASALEQLQATSGLAQLDEPGILQTLDVSPFEEMTTLTSMQGAIASVLVGKQAVLRYCQNERLANEGRTNLRRLVHFIVYLDSLKDSTAPIVLDGLQQIKDQIVYNYLLHLSTQPSLWRFMALYASLLPTDTILSVLPNLLCEIDLDDERRTIVMQLKELVDGLDVPILKSTVMLILDKTTSTDTSKCKSIQWLTHFQEHLSEALVCANTILRHFLLRNKASTATSFVRLHLPDNVIANDEYDNHNAWREFEALRNYLDAMESFDRWKEVMVDTAPETKLTKKWPRSSLKATEMEIADSMERRLLIERKQEASRKVVEAALVAEQMLLSVIAFSGGWLLEDDDGEDDNEERKRKDEMEQLRCKYIPEVVLMLYNVCDETATWMESSLEDGMPRLGKTMVDVLNVLNNADGVLHPVYWIRRAKGFVNIIASDENDLCDAFGTNEMKHLNKIMREIAIRELDYC